jgi:hypothetical protein
MKNIYLLLYFCFTAGLFAQGSGDNVFEVHALYEVCMTIQTEDSNCGDNFCTIINLTDNKLNCPSIQNGDLPTENLQVTAQVLDIIPNCCNGWDQDCQDILERVQDQLNDGGSGFDIDQRGSNRILVDRLLNVPAYYESYRSHFCDLMQDNFRPARLHAIIDQNKALIEDAVEDDVNSLYRFSDFEDDIGDNGIKALLTDRAATLNQELEDMGGYPEPQAITAMDVVINEFLAVNDSLGTTRDADGETDDWIELYNNTDQAMDLSDVYLSDNGDNLFKWQFPAGTTIPADDYLIVWADEDGGQEGLHASFKLNRDGETIYLSNEDGSSIDSVQYVDQETNVSVSRVPNGTGNFVAQHTTFKFSNDTPTSTSSLAGEVAVELYPNPTDNNLNVEIIGDDIRPYTLNVFTAHGQPVVRDMPTNFNKRSLDVSNLAAGMYLLTVRDVDGRSLTMRFVKK